MLIPVCGISCTFVLTILKITGIIEWCWGLILIPILIPLFLMGLIVSLGDIDAS